MALVVIAEFVVHVYRVFEQSVDRDINGAGGANARLGGVVQEIIGPLAKGAVAAPEALREVVVAEAYLVGALTLLEEVDAQRHEEQPHCKEEWHRC
jgi:hypothetical protein